MATNQKAPENIKWNTRQRLQYIELMAFYTGLVTRSDVARSFGISDAAATKDLKQYGLLAPDNLMYRHSVFGFVPSKYFKAQFADLSPQTALPLIAANLSHSGSPTQGESLYGIPVDTLPLPLRLPEKEVLSQITRATRQRRKLSIEYRSLSDRNSPQQRTIEPHTLIDTGLRWHVRAYSDDTFDFRDFVLSRIVSATMLDEAAESSPQYDDDWVEWTSLELAPHPALSENKQKSLLIDYGAETSIQLNIRRALIGYILQKLSVDTTIDHSLNPNAYQLILVNRDEIEPFAGWAFL